MIRILNVLLLIAAIVGGVLAIRQQNETATLRTEFERLAGKAGRLDAKNKDHFYLVRYGATDNKAFRFRLITPAGLKLIRRQTGTFFSSENPARKDSTREPRQIAIVFRTSSERIQATIRHSTGQRATYELASGKEAELISKNWDQLEFEVIGQNSQTEFEEDALIKIFEVRVPAQLIEKLGSKSKYDETKPLLRYEIGTTTALKNDAAKKLRAD